MNPPAQLHPAARNGAASIARAGRPGASTTVARTCSTRDDASPDLHTREPQTPRIETMSRELGRTGPSKIGIKDDTDVRVSITEAGPQSSGRVQGGPQLVTCLLTNESEDALGHVVDEVDALHESEILTDAANVDWEEQEASHGNHGNDSAQDQNDGALFVTEDATPEDIISWDGDEVIESEAEVGSESDDAAGTRAENHQPAAEGGFLQACKFLEKRWCQTREFQDTAGLDNERGQSAPVMSLRRMVLYWKDLGVPDARSEEHTSELQSHS